MKKRLMVFLGTMLIVVIIITMFTIEKKHTISIDETMLNVYQLDEIQHIPSSWILVENRYTTKEYGEISAARYFWTLDGESTSIPDLLQDSLIYENDAQAEDAFYIFAPNRVFENDWPNFSNSTGNYSKDAEIELKANRYGFYCGIGSKDKCQIWYYWAQYENILVRLRLFSIGRPSSLEDFENFVSEFDTQLSNVIGN